MGIVVTVSTALITVPVYVWPENETKQKSSLTHSITVLFVIFEPPPPPVFY